MAPGTASTLDRPDEVPSVKGARAGLLGVTIAVAVFISGGVLLGVEMAASRVLAPFFGSSLFVWGALIGVVLSGLAVGYSLGGILADRYPRPALFIGVMAAGAVTVLAIPVVDQWVLEWIVAWDPGPRLNPAIAAVVLFGPMSVTLACVTPMAVRLLASTVSSLGRTAGRLFSVSTAGSIVGTFLTSFWLVPSFGTGELLAVAAGTLAVTAAVVAVLLRVRALAVGSLVVALVAALVGTSVAPQTGTELSRAASRDWSPVYRLRSERTTSPLDTYEGLTVRFQKDTQYHRVAVVDDEDTRYLRFNSSYQSAVRLDDPYATVFSLFDYFQLLKAYNPEARDVLFLGLGGGSAVKRLHRDFEDLRIETVELDPVVVDVAKEYFGLPDDPERLVLHTEDARQFVADDRRTWDAIAVDVYASDGLPFHISTKEFFELVRSRLRPGGVMIMNVIGSMSGPDSRLLRAIVRTQQSVFHGVVLHPVIDNPDEHDESILNVMHVGTTSKPPTEDVLLDRWESLRAENPERADLSRAIRDRYDLPVAVHDVPVLTDDFAPIDSLLVGNV